MSSPEWLLRPKGIVGTISVSFHNWIAVDQTRNVSSMVFTLLNQLY